MKKHFWKIVIVIIVLVMGGSIVLAKQMEKSANVGVVIKEHSKGGNSESAVTLVEYSDFQCPACGQFYPIIKEIGTQYSNSLKIEYRHFPLTQLHPNAMAAAMAAESAGQQDKFFEMHDKLFENQKAWSTTPAPQAVFIGYAQELGLDVALFKRQMRSSILKDHIKQQQAEALSKGFTGTPSFLLNEQPFTFETFAEFTGGIEAALGVVQPAVDGTVPSSNGVEFGLPAAE